MSKAVAYVRLHNIHLTKHKNGVPSIEVKVRHIHAAGPTARVELERIDNGEEFEACAILWLGEKHFGRANFLMDSQTMKKRAVFVRAVGILLVAVVVYAASHGPVAAFHHAYPLADDAKNQRRYWPIETFYAPIIWWENSSQQAMNISFAYYYWRYLRFNPSGEDPFFGREPDGK